MTPLVFGPAIFGDHLVKEKVLKFRATLEGLDGHSFGTYYSSIICWMEGSCILNLVGPFHARFTGQLIDVAALEAIGVGLWRFVSK